MTESELRLEALAKAATPGPWNYSAPENPGYVTHEYVDGPNCHIGQSKNGDYFTKDMKFIAAANPSAILALFERIKALEGQ